MGENAYRSSLALLTEANGVRDNPLAFAAGNDITSGWNFHAEPIAMTADNLALAIAEIGALAERRIASEIELVLTLHVSRMTVNRALRELSADGLLRRMLMNIDLT